MIEGINDIASVKYGDYKGRIELDGHLGGVLHDLCKDIDFDTEQYFPIAFGVEDSSIHALGPTEFITITIYSVKTDVYGRTFDDIASKIRESDGVANVVKQDVELKLAEFIKYVKRYSIFALQNGLEDVIHSLNIEEDNS